MSLQHTHNALKTQKNVAVYFKDVKTEQTFSSQDRTEASGNYQFVITLLRQKQSSANSLVQRPLHQYN